MRSYVSGEGNKELFTGKELDEGTGLSYFGARYYDAGIGRWLAVDPLAEKYPSLSPYVYCANNPLIYLDGNGKDFKIFIKGVGQIVGGSAGLFASYYTLTGGVPSIAIHHPYMATGLAVASVGGSFISFSEIFAGSANIYRGIIDEPEISNSLSFTLQKGLGVNKNKADAVQLIKDFLGIAGIGK